MAQDIGFERLTLVEVREHVVSAPYAVSEVGAVELSDAYFYLRNHEDFELRPFRAPIDAGVIVGTRGIGPLRYSDEAAFAVAEQHLAAGGHAEALFGRWEEFDVAFVPIGLIAHGVGSSRAVPGRAAILYHASELQPWHGSIDQAEPGAEEAGGDIDVLAE